MMTTTGNKTSSNNSSLSSSLSSSEILSLISEFISYGVSLIVTALMTNFLSATMYSSVVLGIYSLTLLYPLLLRGSSKAIFTYLGKYISESNSENTKAFLSWELRSIVFGSAIFIGLVIVIWLAMFLFDASFLQTKYGIIFPFLGIAPFWALLNIQGNVLLSLKQYKAYFVCDIISQPFWCMVFLGCSVLIYGGLSVKLIILSYYSSYIITVLGQAVWLKVQSNTLSLKLLWNSVISSDNALTWRKYSMKLFVNLEISVLLSTVGVYILDVFSKDPTAAGMYSVILSIGDMFYLTYSAMATVLTPLIAENIDSTKGQRCLQQVINSINLKQVFIGGVLFVMVCLFARPILNLFGSHYTKGVFLLQVYCLTQVVLMFTSNGLTILNYSGKVNYEIILEGCSLIALIIVGAWAAYVYNTTGFMLTMNILGIIVTLIACGIIRHQYNLKVMTII